MAKNWCFTLNNYSSEDEVLVNALYPEKGSYVVVGLEIGDSGTPHLQGYVQLVKKARLTALKKLLPRAHWEMSKGTPCQAAEYCMKDGNYKEYGNRTHERQRSDLEKVKEAIRNGDSLKRIREEHSEVAAKYPRFITEYSRDQITIPKIEAHPLRPWQEELNATLNKEPEDRKIIFLVDQLGNKGKTWFSKYYSLLHENSQILESGKKQDMAHALRQDVRVLFVNCTRQSVEYLQYGFLESVKDGLVFSSKYESGMKYMPPCHVVVTMNCHPDMCALSNDRYDVRVL